MNAIYFKEIGRIPFDPAETRTVPFRLLDGGSPYVPTTHSHPSGAGYFAGDGFLRQFNCPMSGIWPP